MKKEYPESKVSTFLEGPPKQRQSFKNMVQRVAESKSERHAFICADIVRTEFNEAIEKIEHIIKTRPGFRGYCNLHEESSSMLLEAINCSEEIHAHLCAYRTKAITRMSIVKQWADIHFRLWVLAIDKEIIET